MSTTTDPQTAHPTADVLPCRECAGEGAIYRQVRVGQHSHPVACPACGGDGEVTRPRPEPDLPSRTLVDQVSQRAAVLAAFGNDRVQDQVSAEALDSLLAALGEVHMQLRGGQRVTDSDIAQETPLLVPRSTVESWAGDTLTPCEMDRLEAALPHSSIPEAVSVIVSEAIRG